MRARTRDRDRLAEAVYQRVKTEIFEFRLLPGARFSENEVAGQARVSRTPVREALLLLEREGFLEVHPRSGWSVRPLDFERFEHLYDVRVILELAAVRKLCSGNLGNAPEGGADAAGAASGGELLAGLRRIWLAPQQQRPSDWREVARLDEEFHATLLVAVGNPELARIHSDITERIRIVRRLDFTQAERVARTYEEHAAILKAILARKLQQATLLLKSHIELSKLEVRKISIHRLHQAHRGAAELRKTRHR